LRLIESVIRAKKELIQERLTCALLHLMLEMQVEAMDLIDLGRQINEEKNNC
jgi:hypothetical protein